MPRRRAIPGSDVVAGRGQVLRAIKRIVQFIHTRGVKSGDQLPNHQQLAAMISVSNDTLTAAMAKVCELGLVTRRSRAGTIVCDPHAADNLAWTVGLATIPAHRRGQSSYFAEMHFRLQVEIARRGWRSFSYFRFEQGGLPTLSNFSHLPQDLEEQQLDAVLFMTPLRLNDWNQVKAAGVVPLHASFDESLPDTLLLDHPGFIRQSMQLLAQRGAKRIGIATGVRPGKAGVALTQSVPQGIEELGWASQQVEVHPVSQLEGGLQLAHAVLSRPPAARPQAWIVLDDFVALGLASQFAACGHQPDMAACMNSHNPLRFPWPILEFRVNVPDLVDRLMEKLHERLLNPQTPAVREWFAVTPASDFPERRSPSPASVASGSNNISGTGISDF